MKAAIIVKLAGFLPLFFWPCINKNTCIYKNYVFNKNTCIYKNHVNMMMSLPMLMIYFSIQLISNRMRLYLHLTIALDMLISVFT